MTYLVKPDLGILTDSNKSYTPQEFIENIDKFPQKSYILYLCLWFPLIWPLMKDWREVKSFQRKLQPDKRYHLTVNQRNEQLISIKLSVNNRTHIFVEASELLGYRNPMHPMLLEGDAAYLDWLLEKSYYKDKYSKQVTEPVYSPAYEAKQLFGNRSKQELMKQPKWNTFTPDLKLQLKAACCNPALHGVANDLKRVYDVVYDYDCNSMYPYILANLKMLPDAADAKHYDILPMRTPENTMVLCDGVCYLQNQIIIDHYGEGGWIIPFTFPNPWINEMYSAFRKKKELKESGNKEHYRYHKTKMNSFIGMFAQRNQHNRREIFILVTSLARQILNQQLIKAEEKGCHVLSWNTDGFIVDKPLPDFTDSDKLGGWRLDEVLHHASIYAFNRIACDEKISISGLPAFCFDAEHPGGVYYRMSFKSIYEMPELIPVRIDLEEEYGQG